MPTTVKRAARSDLDGARNYIISRDFNNGAVFFVDASKTLAANTAGKGQTPDEPCSNIDYAIGLCTADVGDTIVVLPGHTENISGAAGIALDVAGVKIIGVGEGRRRPRITFITADAASFDISAARCVVDNLVLINGRDGQTAMVNISAADCVIQNCEIMTGDATTQAVIGILTTSAADRLIVRNCRIHGQATAGTTSQISIVGGDFIQILNNIIIGACATNGNLRTVTTDATDIVITGNYMLNRTANANNKNIVLTSSTTGIMSNNRFFVIDSTSPTPWTTAGAHWGGGNYHHGSVDTTGTLR